MSTHRLEHRPRNALAGILATIGALIATAAVLIVALTATSSTKPLAHADASTHLAQVQARARVAPPATRPIRASNCAYSRSDHRCIWVR
jgi:hypothetical protein